MKTQKHKLGPAATLLEDGAMKLVEIGEQSVVLARRDDTYYAFDPHCTHYGAPLQNGVLHGYTVICPWHHACFDIRTGHRHEPPALDSISTYPVTIEDGQVMLELEAVDERPADRIGADQTFVIVGGGAAGHAAAEELRRQGFDGTLILLSATDNVPIDRPNLSKEYMAGEAKPEWMPLRGREWYSDQRIELQLGTRVTAIDPEVHTISTHKGSTLRYDKLLLAPGSYPRTLRDTPGLDLDNIFTLRSQADADQIIGTVDAEKRVVIIGASFIGMEVAASLGKRGAKVSVVEMVEVPFAPVLGEEVGRFLQHLHEQNGVAFHLNTSVAQFHGADGRVTEVELADGTRLLADLVIVGIGVVPATAFLNGSHLAIADHAVVVDRYLQTSAPDVYAAGDVARYPSDRTGTARIEHWRVAQQHGCIAAHNMLGQPDDVNDHVPFFWTSQWGTRLRYVGFAPQWDEIVYRGEVAQGDFIAFYLRDDKLRAAAGVGRDAEMGALEFVLRDDLPVSRADMQHADLVAVASVS